MQVPKETMAGAITALWNGQNKRLSEFTRLWGYWKTMESSIWLLAQTARGLKMQLELAYSKSSRPRMRKVLYSVRCALGLTSFHHTPWGFLKIENILPWWKRQVAHPSASKSSCTSLCSLLHHQTHLLEGGKEAVSVFLVSPLGEPRQGCLHARSSAERIGQAGGKHVSGHFWVTCSMASSSTPCRRDLLLGVVLHEAKTLIHHGIFSHSGWASQSCKHKISIATAHASSTKISLKMSTSGIYQEQDSKTLSEYGIWL